MNSHLLQLVFAQFWQITVLVVLVGLVTRWLGRSRAHFAYVLWLLVVLKCLTPPVISNPSGVFCHAQEAVDDFLSGSRKWSSVNTTGKAGRSGEAMDWSAGEGTASPKTSRPTADPTGRPGGGMVVTHAFVETTRLLRDSTVLIPPPVDSSTRVPPIKSSSFWLVGIPVGLLIVSIAVFVVAILRVAIAVRKAVRSQVDPPAALLQSLKRLSLQLGLRRPPRVILTRETLGPAVLGVFRPTLLLPACVVDKATVEQLEPILIHELLHIRRGDLRIGFLQAVTLSLWWFHPAVWLASRLLTQATERCCDEETVAELGCDPAVYARALLRVLEAKHVLKPIPVVPGIRPVELTSQRIGQIMTLTNGCRTRSPLWCWATLILAAAVVLPGAALIADDEKVVKQPVVRETISDRTSTIDDSILPQSTTAPRQRRVSNDTVRTSTVSGVPSIQPPPKRTTDRPPQSVQPTSSSPVTILRSVMTPDGAKPRVSLTFGDAQLIADQFQFPGPAATRRTYNVSNLIRRYEKTRGVDHATAEAELLRLLTAGLRQTGSVKCEWTRTLPGPDSPPDQDAKVLVVTGPAESHERIRDEISRGMKHGFARVELSIALLRVDSELRSWLPEGFLQEDTPDSGSVPVDLAAAPARKIVSIRTQLLSPHKDEAEYQAIASLVSKNPGAGVISSPRIVTVMGRPASIEEQSIRPVDFVPSNNRESTSSWPAGLRLEVTPTPLSTDTMQLSVLATASDVIRRTFDGEGVNSDAGIRGQLLQSVRMHKTQFSALLPNDHLLIMGGLVQNDADSGENLELLIVARAKYLDDLLDEDVRGANTSSNALPHPVLASPSELRPSAPRPVAPLQPALRSLREVREPSEPAPAPVPLVPAATPEVPRTRPAAQLRAKDEASAPDTSEASQAPLSQQVRFEESFSGRVSGVEMETPVGWRSERARIRNLELRLARSKASQADTKRQHDSQKLCVAVYSVADLLAPGTNENLASGADPDAAQLPNELIQLVTSTVEPDSWQNHGGLGVIEFNANTKALIIRQPNAIQARVADLLAKLRSHKTAATQQSEDEVRVRRYAVADLLLPPTEVAVDSVDEGSLTALMALIRSSVTDGTWNEAGIEFDRDSLTLTIRQTENNHRAVERVLQRARSFDARQILIRACVIEVDKNDSRFAEAMAEAVPRFHPSSVCEIIDADQKSRVETAAASSGQTTVVTRPQVMVLDGQKATIHVGSSESVLKLEIKATAAPEGRLVRLHYGFTLDGSTPELCAPLILEDGKTLIARIHPAGSAEKQMLLLLTSQIIAEEQAIISAGALQQ